MAITEYLNQLVTHYPRSSYNTYGEQVDSSSGVEYDSRFEPVTKQVRLPNGDMKTIDARCFVNGNPVIGVDDRIDYDSIKYRVFSVKKNIDGQGNVHHLPLMLIKWIN